MEDEQVLARNDLDGEAPFALVDPVFAQDLAPVEEEGDDVAVDDAVVPNAEANFIAVYLQHPVYLHRALGVGGVVVGNGRDDGTAGGGDDGFGEKEGARRAGARGGCFVFDVAAPIALQGVGLILAALVELARFQAPFPVGIGAFADARLPKKQLIAHRFPAQVMRSFATGVFADDVGGTRAVVPEAEFKIKAIIAIGLGEVASPAAGKAEREFLPFGGGVDPVQTDLARLATRGGPTARQGAALLLGYPGQGEVFQAPLWRSWPQLFYFLQHQLPVGPAATDEELGLVVAECRSGLPGYGFAIIAQPQAVGKGVLAIGLPHLALPVARQLLPKQLAGTT